MALSASHYDIARFGAEVLRFSPRQADLMFVAGTIVDKEAPVLKTIYDQMPDPKWVISMGVCASSGGFYRSYHTMQGIDEIIPVDVYVPGCPPSPEALIAAVMKIQEKIQKGERQKAPQGVHRLGASGDGAIDRRARRAAWARDDAERLRQGLPPRGVLPLRVIPDEEPRGAHHG
jgi:NADH-quinone oxidoreductase subunit B